MLLLLRRWLPLIIIVLLFATIIYFRWYTYLSFTSLSAHRQLLLTWTAQHYVLSVLSFIGIYIIAVAASVPGAVFLTLAGGFLFGVLAGTLYVVVGATLGATLLFLAVKTALGAWLAKRAHGWVNKLEAGFQENAFNYLLTLRLIPIFPFWLVNIVPALLNIPLRTFIIATFLGIIPGSLVYVLVGNGLGHVFNTGQTPNLNIIFSAPILIPLIALALLSLVPIIYHRIKGKKHA